MGISLIENGVKSTPDVVGCKQEVWDAGPPARWKTIVDRTFIEAGVPDCIGPFLGANNDHPLRTTGSFENLIDYVVGDIRYCTPGTSTGFDGWKRDFDISKERNLGQATLLGGLVSFTTYIPNTSICNPEGFGYLYGVYYQTGTAWYEDVFGREPAAYGEAIEEGVYLGAGLSTTPNIHIGAKEGAGQKTQTSVGQIVEIQQPNLPIPGVKSGRIKWRDIE